MGVLLIDQRNSIVILHQPIEADSAPRISISPSSWPHSARSRVARDRSTRILLKHQPGLGRNPDRILREARSPRLWSLPMLFKVTGTFHGQQPL